MKYIQSKENPFFKRLRLLSHSSRERRKVGRTVLDGVHLVEAALIAGWPVPELVVSESGLKDHEIAALLRRRPEGDVSCLSDGLFSQASPVESPSGILGLIDLPGPLARSAFAGSMLGLEGIQDPGNLGTILRTAAAAGIKDVVLNAGCAQAWHPRVLRAGMGGHFYLRIHEQADVAAALQSYRGKVIATTPGSDGRSLYACDLRQPVAWLFGGEGSGLSAALLAQADERVRIPMSGQVESLNVGATVAICLFEQLRQQSC